VVEEVERIYTIPLREARRAPRTQMARRAIEEIRTYVRRHLGAKGEKPSPVWIDFRLNEAVWARGLKRAPVRIRVRAIRFEDGLIEVSLPEEA